MDSQTRFAYIALAGVVLAPIITGIFGVIIANRTRRTNADTGDKIERSVQRVSSFEDIYVDLKRATAAREYWEQRATQQMAVIDELRRALVDAGIEPPTGADSPA